VFAAALNVIGGVESKPPIVRAVEAQKLIARHARALEQIDVPPPPSAAPEKYWDQFVRWCESVLVRPLR